MVELSRVLYAVGVYLGLLTLSVVALIVLCLVANQLKNIFTTVFEA